ncbi:hypothetical protein CYY_001841 [Polysphondylium violaceum]|uniref:Uncharacterized protein n=1 Tax=Polysphondylium violaceum TaxID=133409 RepID=A0A8J4VA82_9MYCE|nr:hypothetical protein CYY_001841 [Polysphondylium violaceum]
MTDIQSTLDSIHSELEHTMNSIHSIDDIKTLILSSKLSLGLSKAILKSSFKDDYIVLFLILINSIELHVNTKVSFLASIFDMKEYTLARSLLDTNKFTFVELLKCLKIMDSKRNIKLLEANLQKLIDKNHSRKEKIDAITKEYLLTKAVADVKLTEEKKEEKKEEEKKEKEQTPDVNNNNTRKPRATKGSKASKVRKGRVVKAEAAPQAVETDEEKAKKKKLVDKKTREAMFERRYKQSIDSYNAKIRELKLYNYENSLSGNVVNIIKSWIRTVPASTLEYFALGQSKKTWVEIADLLHLSPKDFNNMPWFLEVMFGGKAPKGTIVDTFLTAVADPASTTQTFLDLVEKYKPSYTFLRKNIRPELLNDKIKNVMVKYDDINSLVWWLHEFGAEEQKIIGQRIKDGESLDNVTVGTLLEKSIKLSDQQSSDLKDAILKATFSKLSNFSNDRFTLPSPISIFGDKSGSMSVAIRLASIVGFLLSSLTTGSELSFFDTEDHPSPVDTNSIENLFIIKSKVRGDGGTVPGASMKKLLDGKIFKKYIVLATDEEEYSPSTEMKFITLFKKYAETVNKDVKVIFVSFLGTNQKGPMVAELQKEGFHPYQFVFDVQKPDPSKIDHMLSVLSCESDSFATQQQLLTFYHQLVGDKEFFDYIIKKHSTKVLTFSFNVQISLDILEKLSKQYLETKDNSTLLSIKTSFSRLIEIAKAQKMTKLNDILAEIQSQFITLAKEKGVELLLEKLSTIDKSTYQGNEIVKCPTNFGDE